VAAFLDINGAYDNVNLNMLSKRLFSINIPAKIVNFISLLFSNRSLRLKSACGLSESRITSKGIPQGSVLSPILYSLYCGNLNVILSHQVNILEFADDIVLYTTNKSLGNCETILNDALRDMYNWGLNNGLEVSSSKSAVCVFTRKHNPQNVQIEYNHQEIPCKEQHKFLGVHFDRKLNWKLHINQISQSCFRRMNILRSVSSMQWGADPLSLLILYKSLIRSVLDYACFIFGNANTVNRIALDRIQYSALRTCLGLMKSSPCNAMEVEARVMPLEIRRQMLE
jgi:hypothetical protein